MEITEYEDLLRRANDEKDAMISFSRELDEKLKAFDDLGTPEEIQEALEIGIKGQELIKQYQGIAETPEQMQEALEGGISTIKALREQLEAYKELGTPDQISEAFEASKKVIVESRARDIASARGVKLDTVVSMFEKVNDFKVVEELLDASSTSQVNEDVDDDSADDKPEVVKNVSESVQSGVAAFLLKNHKQL
jgi:hypothetical protein